MSESRTPITQKAWRELGQRSIRLAGSHYGQSAIFVVQRSDMEKLELENSRLRQECDAALAVAVMVKINAATAGSVFATEASHTARGEASGNQSAAAPTWDSDKFVRVFDRHGSALICYRQPPHPLLIQFCVKFTKERR